jgi:GDP-mannose 6-dehydrogenase
VHVLIYGLGYVGLTAAGCLTKEGHKVTGVDVNEDKVREINSGLCPISEPGLDELLSAAVDKGLLRAAQTPGDDIASADVAFVCVGTPSAPDGSHNMSHIAEVSRQIAAAVDPRRKTPLTVVYRSTIRPGSIEEIILPVFHRVLGEDGLKAVEIVYNPEFLREATAIRDYFAPPKIVVGTADGKPCRNMDILHQNIDAPVFCTGYREAEFTKFVDNTWHAVKVAYANEIGRVCLKLGIDPQKVHEIFVSDTKLNISAYYTRPGGAFGGSCLPKDVRALQHLAGDVGASANLIDSLIRSNEAHKHFIYDHCTRHLAPGARVLLVGLAFKANSDDLRESPNVDLAGKLLRAGFKLSIYDPGVEPSKLVGQNLGYAYAHLPSWSSLLVSREEAEGQAFDLVVDASGQGKGLNLRAARFVDVHAFDPRTSARAAGQAHAAA